MSGYNSIGLLTDRNVGMNPPKDRTIRLLKRLTELEDLLDKRSRDDRIQVSFNPIDLKIIIEAAKKQLLLSL